ncbi:LCCL domain-containing protein [Muricoccus radiodurans]|uniref:LCCL domain-containing protein n=1 Tax=Muricoccus radiodurans TaxID=2231721 RepID=UPI003CF1F5AF
MTKNLTQNMPVAAGLSRSSRAAWFTACALLVSVMTSGSQAQAPARMPDCPSTGMAIGDWRGGGCLCQLPPPRELPIWGTGSYAGESSICTAAIHAGVAAADPGGAVNVIIEPGRASYQGSTAHGVTSRDRGPSGRSFRVEAFIPLR